MFLILVAAAASPPSPHTGPYVTPVPYLGPFPGLHLPQAQSSLSTPWSPLRFLRAVGVTPVLVSSSPHQSSTASAVWVPVNFYAIEFTSAVLLASNLASEILSAGSLVKVGGAASGGVLAGLPWLRLTLSSNAALAGATSTLGSLLGTLNGSYLLGCPAAALTAFPLGAKAAAAVAGGALAVGAVPVVLGTVGFTGAGITASSLAAKMMSASAMANGGGVAAGSPAATLQSVGECPRWGLLWKVREDKRLRASSPDLSPGEPQSACAFVSPSVVTLSLGL
nr:interferon alpha-inducible protein 27-like protein 2B [Globicephala melas]